MPAYRAASEVMVVPRATLRRCGLARQRSGYARRMGGAFTGWKSDFKGYFLGLRANNSKAYFDTHRAQYAKRP